MLRNKNPNLLLRQIMGFIYSQAPPGVRLQLMYFEAALFPSLFPGEVDGVPPGALPMWMLMSPNRGHRGHGVANIFDHIRVRIGDPTHPTSKNENYLSFLFDIVLNATLNHFPIQQLQRKGLEGIQLNSRQHGMNINPDRDSFMQFSEEHDNRAIRQLSAMIRHTGPWTYFVTLTCNDMETPGVAGFMHLLKAFYMDDYEVAYNTYLPAIIRLWHRTVEVYLRWIRGKDRPLGDVTHYFARWESQTGLGRANKPHVHVGVTSKPDKDILITQSRIACRDIEMSQHQHGQYGDPDFVLGTFPYDAVENGLVRNEDEYWRRWVIWEEVSVRKTVFVTFIYFSKTS